MSTLTWFIIGAGIFVACGALLVYACCIASARADARFLNGGPR